MLQRFKKRYVGDKAFYLLVLGVVVPIVVQNGITNFVAMLDNIMVGLIGTEPMSGVAVANQLFSVFNVSLFGAVSGAGIFGAQFFGSQNMEGVRDTFRFKIISCMILTSVVILLLLFKGEFLISLFLHADSSNQASAAATLDYGIRYLRVMLVGLVPYTFTQIYASTLREMGETVSPMRAGLAATVVNTMLNYVLIFGKFGAPCLGVEGAAIATVIARFVECGIIIRWTHKRAEQLRFIKGAYRSMAIPGTLVRKIMLKGAPLIVNEILWSVGMAVMSQCYSTYGLDAVAGINISTTISNVCNVVWLAMGNAVGIMVGQLLGAGDMEEAKDTDRKLIAFSVASCLVLGTILAVMSGIFPQIYNTTDAVKKIAQNVILVEACMMPISAFLHTAYFTLRSGGKTGITFFFDAGFLWIISIPLAMVLSRLSPLPLLATYALCRSVDILKSVIGAVLLKKGVWLQNIV